MTGKHAADAGGASERGREGERAMREAAQTSLRAERGRQAYELSTEQL